MENGLDPDAIYDFAARKRLGYRQVLFLPENQEMTWLGLSDSFYRASKYLVSGVLNGSLLEDVEGRAALFLFRHYLELVLKQIVMAGRYLSKEGGLTEQEVKPVQNTHDLKVLWRWVLDDSKPKMPKDAPWDDFDSEFVEKCINEFASSDPKGFSFRYHGQGGEKAKVDFAAFDVAIEHAYRVLEAILTVLIETHGEIQDWLDEQASW